jgi:hypothetical protein
VSLGADCVRPLPDGRRAVAPGVGLGLSDREVGVRPAARAELVHVLRLPDIDRAERIGEFWGYPQTRTFGELLIDLEEDKAARAVVFGLLREIALPPHGEPAV